GHVMSTGSIPRSAPDLRRSWITLQLEVGRAVLPAGLNFPFADNLLGAGCGKNAVSRGNSETPIMPKRLGRRADVRMEPSCRVVRSSIALPPFRFTFGLA